LTHDLYINNLNILPKNNLNIYYEKKIVVIILPSHKKCHICTFCWSQQKLLV